MREERNPEVIPPVHKPWHKRGAIWVRGIGWVWNPDRRPMNLGQEEE